MPAGTPKNGINKGWFKKGHASLVEGLKKGKIKNCIICGKEIIVRPSEEKAGKKFCSHSHYSEWKMGKRGYWKDKKRPEITGDKNSRWKGDNVGYYGLHIWIGKKLGKPSICEHCGKSGLSGKFIQWANKSGEYKRDLTDWIRLCTPCHSSYDNGKLIL